jgi:hypothetical protein
MNHEFIHFRQQIELLIIPFYILYLLNYLINLIRYHKHTEAYRNILFEREAYENDSNLSYLSELSGLFIRTKLITYIFALKIRLDVSFKPLYYLIFRRIEYSENQKTYQKEGIFVFIC